MDVALKKRGGAKLWWRTKSAHPKPVVGDEQADIYLCHACYTQKRDWSAVMPDGYEDVETLDGLLARKQQLDGEFKWEQRQCSLLFRANTLSSIPQQGQQHKTHRVKQ